RLVPEPAVLFTHPTHAEIYTLSLHDALPIYGAGGKIGALDILAAKLQKLWGGNPVGLEDLALVAALDQRLLRQDSRRAGSGNEKDRKSTRLNSSHVKISYAVFCLKKKKRQQS